MASSNSLKVSIRRRTHEISVETPNSIASPIQIVDKTRFKN